MAVVRDLIGNYSTVEDKAIDIDIARYNELIRKEALFDKLCENNDVLVLLNMKNKEEK